MIRTGLLVAALASGVLACGGQPIVPEVVIERPAASIATTPHPVAIVEGRTRHAHVLVLAITSGEDTFTFETARGRWLAFRHDPSAFPPRTVRWPDATASPPRSIREDLEARVEGIGLAPASTLSADGRAVVVEIHPEGTHDVAEVVHALERPGGDVRLLMVVRPQASYVTYDGVRPPRLARGEAPWREDDEAFRTFKQREVETYLDAMRAEQPYVPTTSSYVVLPRADLSLAPSTVDDFEVLEWPADPAHRVDHTWVERPLVGVGEAGRPEIEYDVAAARQGDFHAWTEANLGLPMALVLDDRVLSAPVIQSPLRDRVRITLGSGGSRRALRAEAQALANALALGPHRAAAQLVAAVTWHDDGRFEIVLSPDTPDTVLAVRAVDVDGRESAAATRTLRFRPNTESEATVAVSSVLAGTELGLFDLGTGSDTLRPFGEGAVLALEARVLDQEAAATTAKRQELAVELAGRLDLQAEATQGMLQAVVASTRRPELRRLAVAALGRMSPLSAEARRCLENALGDASADIRIDAAHALLASDADGTDPLARLLPLAAEDPEGVFRAVSRHVAVDPEPAIELLLEEATHATALRRRQAALLLANTLSAPTRAALLALLVDPDQDVRRAAARGLAFMNGDVGDIPRLAIDRVVARLGAEHVEPRAWAASALAAYGEAARPHLDALRGLLDDEAKEARIAAAWALGQLGASNATAKAILDAALEEAEARSTSR